MVSMWFFSNYDDLIMKLNTEGGTMAEVIAVKQNLQEKSSGSDSDDENVFFYIFDRNYSRRSL